MSFVPLFCPNPTCPHHHRKNYSPEEKVLLTKKGRRYLGKEGRLGA